MEIITVDTTGQTCPMPLVNTRKAINSAEKGQKIEIIGDHLPSKTEIPMAVTFSGLEVVKISETNGKWHIIIKKTK